VRRALLLAAAAIGAALAACPLPQPVPEIARVDGGSIAPPRIVGDSAQPPETLVAVRKDCPAPARFNLSAVVDDSDTTEQVEVRWFLDYDAIRQVNLGIIRTDELAPPPTPVTTTLRTVPAFSYFPKPFDPAGPQVHVVEMVVSNGFAPEGDLGIPLPNRTPLPGFETQVFRWVFEYDDDGRCSFP
jgi:hypothetical protein